MASGPRRALGSVRVPLWTATCSQHHGQLRVLEIRRSRVEFRTRTRRGTSQGDLSSVTGRLDRSHHLVLTSCFTSHAVVALHSRSGSRSLAPPSLFVMSLNKIYSEKLAQRPSQQTQSKVDRSFVFRAWDSTADLFTELIREALQTSCRAVGVKKLGRRSERSQFHQIESVTVFAFLHRARWKELTWSDRLNVLQAEAHVLANKSGFTAPPSGGDLQQNQ